MVAFVLGILMISKYYEVATQILWETWLYGMLQLLQDNSKYDYR